MNSLLMILSAILLSGAFSSFNLDCLSWFAFVPLFFALEGKSKLQSFIISYICGFLFFIISMYWIFYVTGAGWIMLSLYQAIYFGIFGLVFNYFSKPYRYIALPSAWVILEYMRAHFAGGIGWNLLGYSQYKNIPLIQIADITGVLGVSFLIILMNVAIYAVIKMAINCYRLDPRPRLKGNAPFGEEFKNNPAIPTLSILIVFISVLIYGYKAAVIDNTADKFKISVVQGSIPQEAKWDETFKRDIMARYQALSIQAAEDGGDLIVWPETAVPGYLYYDHELSRWIKTVLEEIKTPLLAGAPIMADYDMDKSYNSAVLFSEEGKILERYDKLHLVMFGEYIPLEENFPILRKLFPISGNFIPGNEYTVFNIGQVKFSTLICFEDIFPALVRKFVKNGADFVVNITNDAWFKETAAAYQHAACSVFRAVENRRPVVRAANTGLSCFIDKTGRIYEKVSENGKDLFIPGVKSAFISIESNKKYTFYTKYGDIFVLICIVMAGVCFAGKMFLTI
ncbi:MAG: apolipoprotein N-acyltransferase [Candidatus Omnitrophica bacterium]|nr:apolipoprotein N-acyltransferase [Candidatus Omnitrophota bacterium]